MKNKISKGSLCYFRRGSSFWHRIDIVLVFKELYDLEQINNPYWNTISYYVLFPSGKIDTVPASSLRIII